MVDQAVLDKLEAGFTKVSTSDSKSLLKKYLTKEVFDALKTKKTSFGSTLLDVIQSGVENLDSGVGIYAPDAEAYTVFAELFDPIIDDPSSMTITVDSRRPTNTRPRTLAMSTLWEILTRPASSSCPRV